MKFSCDCKVHYPLGGASYVFEKDLIKYCALDTFAVVKILSKLYEVAK